MAYALAQQSIRDSYTFENIIFRREDTEALAEKLDSPAVVAFSCYLWNFEFNKALAEKLKEKYPDCFIVFGGHHVSPDDDLLAAYPFIDCLIYGEGEEIFAAVLDALAKQNDLGTIPNIRFRRGNEIVSTRRERMTGTDYPSPYLTGCFDALIEENENIFRNMYIETNRGCPFSCAYCDWGCTKNGVKLFPMERVKAEIDWAATHDIDLFGICDANFGMFERDSQITDYIVEAHRQTGSIRSFQTSFFEGVSQRVFDISKKLEDAGINKGVTLSLQSLNDDALKNIGRKNLSLQNFSRALDFYKANGITVYSELIMGLPGETRDSFADGINTLLTLGQHTCIYIHVCELLPCSPMAQREYREKFGIHADRILLNQPHRDIDDPTGIPEYSYIVTSTNTLSKEDWVWLNMFSAVVQAFHFGGPLKLAAIWLFLRAGVSYRGFYTKLLEHLLDQTDGSALKAIYERLAGIPDKHSELTFFVPDLVGFTLSADEYLLLSVVKNASAFYESVNGFLLDFSDSDEFRSLIGFQKNMLNRPELQPFEFDCEYDFLTWFTDIFTGKEVSAPAKKKIRYTVSPAYYRTEDYARYVVWYGKKTADKNLFSVITSVSNDK
ncbi:MAG: cobalamin-dependent protein [Clostridia bacterium]|nr:cobalamin-dependent protein [Clostridia bacterium]